MKDMLVTSISEQGLELLAAEVPILLNIRSVQYTTQLMLQPSSVIAEVAICVPHGEDSL